MIEDLARMIIEAQRIREDSWDATEGTYRKTMAESAHEAGGTSGLDTRADDLVHILLVAVWNDAGDWAERCLKPDKERDSMIEQIDRIKELADRPPTGLNDPLALSKLEAEMIELEKAILSGDHIASVMEAGDVCYYAIKAEATGLIDKSMMINWLNIMSAMTFVPERVLLQCCVVKYSIRAEEDIPKDVAAERRAVTHQLWEFLLGEAEAIRYLIIKSGGMANKSKVEDVLMARHPNMRRDEAHEALNQVEFMNDEWFRIGNPTIWTRSNVPEPKVEDYPEIEEVMK